MTKIFLKSVSLILIICFFFLFSCSKRSENTDYKLSTGYLLSEIDISKINDQYEKDQQTAESPEFEINENTVYYWTEGGSKLHLFKECQSLSKSDPSKIKSGTLEKAYTDQKTEPCSFCLNIANIDKSKFPIFNFPKDSENSETDITGEIHLDNTAKETDLPESNTVYIWTKSGSKLHIFEDCTYLSRTAEESKIRGNKADALNYGIEEICSSCQKNAKQSD